MMSCRKVLFKLNCGNAWGSFMHAELGKGGNVKEKAKMKLNCVVVLDCILFLLILREK